MGVFLRLKRDGDAVARPYPLMADVAESHDRMVFMACSEKARMDARVTTPDAIVPLPVPRAKT
ncbi:MAG TPA: hypothetical protein VN230_08980, partial [Burkholderiaceae bacterium]|nr:hypothetical protein [Burkholderiaceae bacterium]